MTLQEIVRACGGSFGYPSDMETAGICADVGEVKKGSVFIALKDGDDLAVQAVEKGAEAVICERPIAGVRCVIVDSVRHALLALAAYYRKSFPVKLIAVTGSVGKTSVTEMLHNILELSGESIKTEDNCHDETGLSLTLLRLEKQHKTAAVEMGLTAERGISALSAAAQPDAAVITNIGHAHLENYGSQENILKAKLAVLDGAAADAPLILNMDDKLLAGIELHSARKVVYYSMKDKKADVWADSIRTEDERVSFNINYQNERIPVRLNCMGDHNVGNALAAFAAAAAVGIDPEQAKKGLERYVPDGFRQQFIKTAGCRVLADLGNFSPEAVRAAVSIVNKCKTRSGGRRIAVLSDMPSLGKKSAALHRSVGESLERSGIDMLLCIDDRAAGYIQGAVKKGLPEDQARLFSSPEELCAFLKDNVRPEDVVLLKCRREYSPFSMLEALGKP